MNIRDANVEDVNAIAKVYLDSVVAAYCEIATEGYLATRNLPDCISQWTYNIDDDSLAVIVAEEAGIIQGVASFSEARDADVDTTTTAELQAIYVSPTRRAEGVGRQLCRRVMDRIYSGGVTSILLWVLSDNVRATRFYERTGFNPDGASKTVKMGRELTAVRYKHSLSGGHQRGSTRA